MKSDLKILSDNHSDPDTPTRGYTYLLWDGEVIKWRPCLLNRPRFETYVEARLAGRAEAVRRRELYLNEILEISVAIAEMDTARKKFEEINEDRREDY